MSVIQDVPAIKIDSSNKFWSKLTFNLDNNSSLIDSSKNDVVFTDKHDNAVITQDAPRTVENISTNAIHDPAADSTTSLKEEVTLSKLEETLHIIENNFHLKKENGTATNGILTQKADEKEKENGVTLINGQTTKTTKTTRTKMIEKKQSIKIDLIKKPKSETIKRKKKGENRDKEHESEKKEKKAKSRPLTKSKSEVTTTQKKNRSVDPEEFKKFENLLNQKTLRIKK